MTEEDAKKLNIWPNIGNETYLPIDTDIELLETS